MSFWPKWNENKPFALVLMILFVFLIVFVSAQTEKALRESDQVGKPDPFEHSISVDAQGRVTGTPDIATVSMSIQSRGADVATAQADNRTKMNALLANIKALGVEDADIQTTNYSVYQESLWNPDTQTYDYGDWIVDNSVSVKIRDTEKISDVIDTAGSSGATNIYGPNFTIDDLTNLKTEAREEALVEIAKKATELQKTLGVRFERVVGYSEWMEYPGGYPPYYYADTMAMGGGGSPISPGSQEVILNVSVQYKLVE